MITGLSSGEPPVNDMPHLPVKTSAPQTSAPSSDDVIVQISSAAQQLVQADDQQEADAGTSINGQKHLKQQKKPKTLLDYIDEADQRGRRTMRNEATENRKALAGNWMPAVEVGDGAAGAVGITSVGVVVALVAAVSSSDSSAKSGPAAG